MRVSEDSLPRIDVHQHLWSEPLVAELFRRSRPPRVRSTRGGLFPYGPSARAAMAAAGGRRRLDLAIDGPARLLG